MKTHLLIKHTCLALLLFMSAGVTQAAEDIAGKKQLDLRRRGDLDWRSDAA